MNKSFHSGYLPQSTPHDPAYKTLVRSPDGSTYKTINLPNGIKTIVDEEDYEYLKKYSWHIGRNGKRNSFCVKTAKRTASGKIETVRIHRLITGAKKGLVVDHINHDTLDNRKCNLRVVKQQENLKNTSLLKKNSSGVCGVKILKRKKSPRWLASIGVNGKNIYLGIFKSKEDAVLARLVANDKYGFHPNHGSA